MHVTLEDGQKYRFSFKHITQEADLYYELLIRDDRSLFGDADNRLELYSKATGITLAFVAPLDVKDGDAEVPPVAFALCKDPQYDNEMGRKFALTHALKAMGFGRGARAAFWKAYHERGKKQ